MSRANTGAMTAAVLGLVSEGETEIDDVDCIKTSFPRFVGTLRALGFSKLSIMTSFLVESLVLASLVDLGEVLYQLIAVSVP